MARWQEWLNVKHHIKQNFPATQVLILSFMMLMRMQKEYQCLLVWGVWGGFLAMGYEGGERKKVVMIMITLDQVFLTCTDILTFAKKLKLVAPKYRATLRSHWLADLILTVPVYLITVASAYIYQFSSLLSSSGITNGGSTLFCSSCPPWGSWTQNQALGNHCCIWQWWPMIWYARPLSTAYSLKLAAVGTSSKSGTFIALRSAAPARLNIIYAGTTQKHVRIVTYTWLYFAVWVERNESDKGALPTSRTSQSI